MLFSFAFQCKSNTLKKTDLCTAVQYLPLLHVRSNSFGQNKDLHYNPDFLSSHCCAIFASCFIQTSSLFFVLHCCAQVFIFSLFSFAAPLFFAASPFYDGQHIKKITAILFLLPLHFSNGQHALKKTYMVYICPYLRYI